MRVARLVTAVAASFALSAAFAQRMEAAASCESLAQLALPEAKVTSAQIVAQGTFAPPAGMTGYLAGDLAMYKALPEFCRVLVDAKPSADSDIKIEVWLPTKDWNGKLRGQGNGGFAGELNYAEMALAVSQNYATATTDTGHAGNAVDATWALGHPEKVTDFGYRAIHLMTEVAKSAIKGFYGNGPRHSYFAACSNGGRQALMEAQRYPADYDGILAGAPAYFWTHLLTNAVFNEQVTTAEPGSYIPVSKVAAIAHAVNEACDAKDGVSDGVLNDPRQCRFDATKMLCKARESDSCLTAPQAKALNKLYEGARDAKGKQIFPGFPPGAEEGNAGWGLWITGPAEGKSLLFAFGNGYFSNMVYEKADWSYKGVNLDEALSAAEKKTVKQLNATDVNLGAFQARGGKLVIYHGWNDPAISAISSIEYYDGVTKKMGDSNTAKFMQLYLVPGMQHCADGAGANSFGQGGPEAKDSEHNVQLAVERWVEKGVTPSGIIATKYTDDDSAKPVKMTRPLCAYPQVAKYKGSGDTNDAANFTCAAGNK